MEYPKWKENGKIKLAIIVGTRPEIIRLAAVITKARKYFDTQLWHTGQNYDYTLNGIFFRDLGLADPDLYLDAVGDDLGATMGNIIDRSYKAMAATKPDAVLVLGDTTSIIQSGAPVIPDSPNLLSSQRTTISGINSVLSSSSKYRFMPTLNILQLPLLALI